MSWSYGDYVKRELRDTDTIERKIRQQRPKSQTEVLKSSSSMLPLHSPHPPNYRPGEDKQISRPWSAHAEEIFHILPMHGCLQPGDQQLVTFSFFSNESISSEAIALCNLRDGPTYEIIIKGETSVISCSVEPTRLDLGPQVFSCVGEADIKVKNTGKVGFDFSVLYLQSEEEENNSDDKLLPEGPQQNARLEVRPGRPVVFPAVGHIEAGSEQDLCVLYLPGVPEVFEKHFQVQVDVLPPEDITLTGVGVFPRVMLNLPQDLSDECFSNVMELAKTSVGADRVGGELTHGINAGGQTSCTLTDDELLQMEIERLMVKENAHVVSGILLDLRDSRSFFSQWHKLSKFQLPEYVLSFGFAIPGKVFSESVNIINNGSVPVSFQANCKHLAGTGFTAEFKRVKNLPCGETHTFTVQFDPQGANLEVGETSVLLPIKISGGPQVMVRLCAVVTVPTITASENTLQFDTVQYGMCQIKTIHLLNQEPVPCHWSMAEEVKPIKKVHKYMHIPKRILEEHQPPPPVFEMMPCAGVLSPGERINVLIMFRPTEGGSYRRQLKVHVADSPQKQVITALGQCEEPQLEFCPSLLELGPCLPFDTEAEAEVRIKNPCSFPVEFYSLEFDTEYLTEEKILRLMPEYDEKNMLLLPPRIPGHGLPTELLDHYKEYSSQLEGDELNAEKDETKKHDTRKENEKSKLNNSLRKMSAFDVKPVQTIVSELIREANNEKRGELELTPVSRAIARHMGLDLSPEGLMACSGIAVTVYGAPLIDQAAGGTTKPESPGSAPASLAPVDFEAEQNETHLIAHQDTENTHNPFCEVLDHLGLRPSDPPIPLPITFSVVPFPNQRDQVMVTKPCFIFLDPSALNKDEEEKKPVEEDTESKRGKHLNKRKAFKTKLKLEGFRPLLEPSYVTDQTHHQKRVEMKRNQSLTTFRWVVPPNGEVLLKVWFYSELPGEFGQVFNFELTGTRKLYQLTCRGCCSYPSICNKYKTLFAHSEKVPPGNDGLQRAYMINPGYFEFGPLLCSQMRDGYKENRYPENSERMVIHNNSSLEAEVKFSFQHDTEAATYLLEPPVMTLTPGQKQELTVWAYPTKQGQIKDSVICHIKDNPEPVIINISCWGVTPQLELERKHLHFGRTLVHRRDSRSIMMFNRTALPVAWKMLGVNELSDFVVPQAEGLIPPNSSFPFTVHFKAKKLSVIKKTLHLEVSDVEKILGTVQTTNIQVTAETYDAHVEIKPDTKLDFGNIRVFQEAKLSLKLSNRGQCKLAYKFKAEQGNPALPNPESIFTVSPLSDSLFCKKTTTVHIVCRPDREISVKEQPLLSCQVIEPSLGENGEIIATLDILISVQSVFSRYKITPAYDLDFGPLLHGTKKTQSFTIENSGVLSTQFTISCKNVHSALQARSGSLDKLMPKGNTGLKVGQEPVQGESTVRQNRLTIGMFVVFPCNGSLQPGSQQQVTVDCMAEQLGTWNQNLLIEINGRNPSDHPDGIPYRLRAEVWKPAIDLDMTSIFEEHFLCHNSSQLSSEQFSDAKSIFALDENKFIFNKVLVGKATQARFKLTNSSKVPCGLNLAIKCVRPKVFDLPVTTLNIPRQSHVFAVVTFTPQAMQHYSAVFEATLEWHDRRTPTLKSILNFDMVGEGTMPNVSVVRPAQRNSTGSRVMHFGRVLVGRRQTLPLVLLNDGNIPAQVQIDMLDESGVFTIKAASGNTNISIHSTQPEDTDSGGQLVHRAVLTLNVNEQRRFEVSFCSDKPTSVKTNMAVQVKDNQYSNTMIQVTGESYQQIVSLDISRSPQETDQDDEKKGNCEVLHFGDCQVDCVYRKSFIITNHSISQVVRFEWPLSDAKIIFSPQVGHLHPKCSKEVVVTFKSSRPVTLSQSMRCKICQVTFQQPQQPVADWDDRYGTVQCQPVVHKVTKTDPEPVCSLVEGSQLELDLLVTAVCDHVKFSCSTNSLHFKDTMIFQTSIHQLQIVNVGKVRMEFSWDVFMDSASSFVNHDQRDETSTPQPGSNLTRCLSRSRPSSALMSAGRPSSALMSAGRPSSALMSAGRPSSALMSAGRPSSALSSIVSLLKGNLELAPFSVEPSSGTIDPGTTQNFSIRFSPVEVTQYQGKLLCSIPNLQEGDQGPNILALGRSLLPHCHFDLEDSDYISGNRRCPEITQSLDPNTRVLEFEAVGLFAPTRRCFNVVNPTSEAYSFRWRCEDTADMHFCCLQSSGTIQPGKKVEMSFEYVAEHKDTVESSWSFGIETLSLSVPFLLVGTTREPVVYFNKPYLDFGELIVGCQFQQTVDLVNVEEEPVHFSVLQSSLCSEDQQSRLILKPMNGTVASKNRLPLSVFFKPTSEGPMNFRLNLKVKRKSEPLTLTVKADCFSVSASVQVKTPDGDLREITPNRQDTLDFGMVGISEQSSINILVSNLSKFILEVNFELTGPREQLQHLELKPPSATIEAGKQLLSPLLFSPQSICSLHGVTLNLKVKLGPTFVFSVEGRAEAPSLEFSFTEFNFGKCFLYGPGTVPPSRILEIRNKGTQNVRVQSHFKNTAFLEMDFQPDVLFPGAAMEVPVTFYPREACRYHEKLTFILNSCITKHVDIQGQGIERKLEVKRPRQKRVKLGILMVGQEVKERVVLVNHSSLDLCFTLTLSTNTPLDPKVLSVSPAELTLKSNGGSCTAEIQFSPQQLLPPFSAELQAAFPDLLHPLLTITGCCQGVEVELDQDSLSFGAVVQCCQSRKKIVMMNTGDIGARFHWTTEQFPAQLSVAPVKGYISPGMEVSFEVTFAPLELSGDTRYENLSCCVEGASSPITLTVTGSCVAASTDKQVENFVCPVRSSQTHTLSVLNPTDRRCSITPVIEGKQWSAELSVTFEPHQKKSFDITYRPLTMTTDEKKHQGSVFFSFPDGRGMLYLLQGTAVSPEPEDIIKLKLPAKTNHCEVLSVNNWLPKQQWFSVLLEMVKPEKTNETVSLKGPKHVEVPALSKRDYKMSFFAYKEENYMTKVTFCNEATNEYLFYLIQFEVTAPGVLSTIELEATVRRVASATLHVENPLTTATSFTTECNCRDISVQSQHTVPGQSEGALSFKYLPLQPGESTTRLSLFSKDLGYFHYKLLLKALPPPPEKVVYFNTCLGSSHSVLVKFINYCPSKTKYSCKTDCPDFIVDTSVAASPSLQSGSELSVEVCFEPHQQGQVKGQLSLTSGVGGEYIFPLHGICLPPKAQGPFSIEAGQRVTVPFKNVFLQTTAFSFQVDNPCFSVNGGDSIPSKKTQNIVVSFKAPSGGSSGPWFGKLTVSSQRSESHIRPCSWCFYLKGHQPPSS